MMFYSLWSFLAWIMLFSRIKKYEENSRFVHTKIEIIIRCNNWSYPRTLEYLNHIKRIISLGHKHDSVRSHFDNSSWKDRIFPLQFETS